MAKIKRIVTSEIEGRTLSDRYDDNSYIYNNEGLIQYYGEGNQMSAVLSPGIIYGANGDSGDGAGLNTIKLIPNYDYGSDQHIIIDPTAPNHIHIRAGGIQDGSNAELILGAEKTYVKVSDGSNDVQIKTHQPIGEGGENEYYWSFGSDGTLYGPAMGGLLVTAIYGSGQDYPLLVGSNDKVLVSGTNGEFLRDPEVPANQIATIGDVQNIVPQSTAWTPVLSGSGLAQSSNPATGSYIKFGSLVMVNLTVSFNTVTNFGTGQYSITLPFAAAKHTDLWAGTLHNTSSQDFYSIKGHVDAQSDIMTLWAIASTLKDEPFKYNYPIVLDNTDLFHMSFIYESI